MKRLGVVLWSAFALSCLAIGAQEPAPVQCCGNQEFVAAQDQAPKRGLGYRPSTPEVRRKMHAAAFQRHQGRQAMLAQNTTLPPAFDCRSQNWVPPIGDQGSCGSCYLYSTTETITASFIKAGYAKNDGSFLLSVQFGMDCHPEFGGCNGGNGTEVIDYYVKHGGLPAEKYVDASGKTVNDYPPYEARSRQCRKVPGAKMWVPANWGFCTSDQSDRKPTLDEIKTAMVTYGVINIAIDAGGQFGNGTGTITSLGNNIDHEIECVAYDDSKDGGAFLLRNQWSTDWGNQGYRWCTYKAATHIVDWFWVSASPLPPPPPPPPQVVTVTCPDVSGQPGVAVVFDVKVTGAQGNPTFTFEYGDGMIGTIASHSYARAGSYNVRIGVTDSAGNKANTTCIASIGVTPPPPPGPTPSGLTITLGPEWGDKAGRYLLTPDSQAEQIRGALDILNRVFLPADQSRPR